MKKSFAFFVIMLVVLLSNTNMIQAATLTTQSIPSPTGTLYVGDGYNLLTGEIAGSALISDTATRESMDSPYQDQSYSSIIKTPFELKQYLQNDFYNNPYFDYFGLGISNPLHQTIFDTLNFSSRTLTMVYSYSYFEKTNFINGVFLNDQALSLVNQGLKEEFAYQYGDVYVHSVQIGARLYLIFQATIPEKSTVGYEDLEWAFKLKVQDLCGTVIDPATLTKAEEALHNIQISSNIFTTNNYMPYEYNLSKESIKTLKTNFINYVINSQDIGVITKLLQRYPSITTEPIPFRNISIQLDQLEEWDKIKSDLELMLTDQDKLPSDLVYNIITTLNNIVYVEISKFNTMQETRYPENEEFMELYQRHAEESSVNLSEDTLIRTGSNFTQKFILLDKNSDKYVLSFYGRIHTYGVSGAAPVLKIIVNGTTLPEHSLINKAQVRKYSLKDSKYKFTYRDGRVENWYNAANQSWTLFYASNMCVNNITSSVYGIVGGEATNYEFDITPYMTTGLNTIELVNTAKSGNKTIVIEDFQIMSKL